MTNPEQIGQKRLVVRLNRHCMELLVGNGLVNMDKHQLMERPTIVRGAEERALEGEGRRREGETAHFVEGGSVRSKRSELS